MTALKQPQQDRQAVWRYTISFITDGRWQELPDHLDETTPDHVMGAMCYGLDYSPHNVKNPKGYLSTDDARRLMNAVGAWEPNDRKAVMRTMLPPSPCRQESGKVHWPVNCHYATDPEDRAWGRIFGIEAGWLAYDRAGFLGWTEQGRARYAAGDNQTFTEAGGQVAFAF